MINLQVDTDALNNIIRMKCTLEIDVENEFKDRIDKIWNSEKYRNVELLKYGYAAPKNLITNSILFIGINPSNSNDTSKKEFYYLNQDGSHHKYFKKFSEISNKIRLPWSHLDLLFVRKTEQKAISLIEKEMDGIGKDFLMDQLLISKELIERSTPQVIVVNNTLARKYLGKSFESKETWIGYDFLFEESVGTYFITNCEKLKNVPVFFSSMLTGQRALDKGSFERLTWHINQLI